MASEGGACPEGRRGGALKNGVSVPGGAPVKGTRDRTLTPSVMGGHSEQTGKRVPSGHHICRHPDLGLPASGT